VSERLELVEPSNKYKKSFLEMAQEYVQLGTPPERVMYREALDSFSYYLRKLQGMARGEGLLDGWTMCCTYWLVRDGTTVVASSTLRQTARPQGMDERGHIGYGTRPSQRGRGYGTEICRLTLRAARETGFGRVLITCDSDNQASARIIEKNGGTLDAQIPSSMTDKIKNWYWIEILNAD